MIIIKIFLHGKPNWFLPLEGAAKVDPEMIRIYADQLKEQLYSASSIVEKLQKNWWYLLESYGAIYYLEYCKFDTTLEQAKRELAELNINQPLMIEELNLENVC